MRKNVKINYPFRINSLQTGCIVEQIGVDIELWQELRRIDRKTNKQIREVQTDE